MVMYGYCLLRGANVLSDGSEMLLEVLDPGLIGGMLPWSAPDRTNTVAGCHAGTHTVDCALCYRLQNSKLLHCMIGSKHAAALWEAHNLLKTLGPIKQQA